jgi:antitoxin CptB
MRRYMPAPVSDRMSDTLSPRARKILFRATHRGTKEADLLIGGFVTRHIAAMAEAEAELDALEAVLAHADADLVEWLTGRKLPPPEARSPLLERMIAETATAGSGMPEAARRGLGRAS